MLMQLKIKINKNWAEIGNVVVVVVWLWRSGKKIVNSKAKLLQLIMLKEEHENNLSILASYVNIFTTFVG
jgi:hypothetical protein